MYIYIYTYIYIHVCRCVYIYICIHVTVIINMNVITSPPLADPRTRPNLPRGITACSLARYIILSAHACKHACVCIDTQAESP